MIARYLSVSNDMYIIKRIPSNRRLNNYLSCYSTRIEVDADIVKVFPNITPTKGVNTFSG